MPVDFPMHKVSGEKHDGTVELKLLGKEEFWEFLVCTDGVTFSNGAYREDIPLDDERLEEIFEAAVLKKVIGTGVSPYEIHAMVEALETLEVRRQNPASVLVCLDIPFDSQEDLLDAKDLLLTLGKKLTGRKKRLINGAVDLMEILAFNVETWVGSREDPRKPNLGEVSSSSRGRVRKS